MTPAIEGGERGAEPDPRAQETDAPAMGEGQLGALIDGEIARAEEEEAAADAPPEEFEYSDAEGRFEGDPGFDPEQAADHELYEREMEAMGEEAMEVVGDVFDRREEFEELVEQLPGLNSMAAQEEVRDLLRQVEQLHGRAVASHPLTVAAAYEFTGGSARWDRELQADEIRRELIASSPRFGGVID